MGEMSDERKSVIAIMKAAGWSAERVSSGKQASWEFRRSDGDGFLDVVKVKQSSICLGWLIWRSSVEEGMREVMQQAAKDWLKNNFPRQMEGL